MAKDGQPGHELADWLTWGAMEKSPARRLKTIGCGRMRHGRSAPRRAQSSCSQGSSPYLP